MQLFISQGPLHVSTLALSPIFHLALSLAIAPALTLLRVQGPRSLESISGWHSLAAAEILARRYESILSGVCLIAIFMLWFVSSGLIGSLILR
jgi:hypothetical protein